MDKLIMRLSIILIGLSILLSCDPKEAFQDHLYQRTFKNNSNQEIKLVYHNFGNSGADSGNTIVTDTLVLPPSSKKQDFFEPSYSSDGVIEGNNPLIIETNIRVYNTTARGAPKFELFLGSEFIREWKGEGSYLGDEINSPYNFDSWEVIKFDEILNPSYGTFIYGEIVFTITDKDIE
ncbi:hypothetical protein L0P88_17835 [Muricauda sp. SCSIO 64092]|uniref:hypothetical protein n=1 Tax=Allomuricauda sp. SCSIO 64092 TaxID=2908842 RepID=UPI001FF27F29|nr:hypothetical protein [Muricauda sp. SCSIO 64092]UOY05788.1 hypothetical protein L0P88_17835 [Muricauda sp. SCSIO 64092]